MAKFRSLSTWGLALASSCAALNTALVITNAIVAPDGYPLNSIVVNGQYPGPVLTAQKGERFQINVMNQLEDASMNKTTSIHWHGIKQLLSNEMDGAAMVTQCPIASGQSFLYDFTPDQSGSFWYHSHLGLQYCEGLRGSLIIYDPEDPHLGLYDVDDESTIINLMDWYHMNANEVGVGPADATLINGRGRYNNGPLVPLSVISVMPGRRYRMRLTNMACRPNYLFSIDNHNFTVIEADGHNTVPVVVDSIRILAGQRYSFILEANQPVDNYWILADPNLKPGFTSTGGLNSAILSYVGAPPSDPPTRKWTLTTPLLETNLHALEDSAAPGLPQSGGADLSLNLVNTFDSIHTKYLINGVTYTSPPTPVLLQILSGQLNASELQPQGSVFALPANKVIELSIPGGQPDGPHPFHLHGHSFSVVRSAGSTTYNYNNPVRRDTTSNGFYGWDNVTIRFVTDNPGPWFLHCHIDWHLEQGMAVVFAADAQDTAKALNIPPSWNNLCPIYNALAPTDL
ncbi:laccase T2 copper depleted [Rhizopogon vinicolor AM-OR11-026]|uniref:laccase n=1 Tax=Rhizopogon vinicolor AM-OR11-026 TaxID=1314800 RepID=A0A1B7NF73_9AGAM|nr:laccase T2 copper depleted [Rhizopogon vinicolor AM-OR11-026]